MNNSPSLKPRLQDKDILLAPGIYDALSAHIAEMAGAEAVYLSGASIAYTRFARPDIGLVSMSEVADTLSLVCDRVSVPVIVDADNGYGNALNVQRTVRVFENAGATALQLEDQAYPKRCGHLTGKTLIGKGEMAGKIEAACDARSNDETLIIARTDAIAVEGLEKALERAETYADAGADVLFVEAPQNIEQMRELTARLGGKAPLLANMVEGSKTPLMSAKELQELGYSMVIFPAGLVRAQARLTSEFFEVLISAGTTEPFKDRMLDFSGVNALIGTDELLSLGKKYEKDDQ
ncbi:MAG: isocitrate lyase/PEP mutase family protein [Hyphomicrobiales bacterium]